ncbi:MAG: hypothetical protein ACJ795_20640 [Ktedonobacteraceae bacterium]
MPMGKPSVGNKVVNLFIGGIENMGGSSFDLIMQEVINQKQYLDELVEENQNLQRQLAELRAGRNILLEVCGQRFTLNGEAVVVAHSEEVSPKEVFSASQETTNIPLSETSSSAIPDTELPAEPARDNTEQQTASRTSFLEELMVDEFTAAATSPMHAWINSPEKRPSQIDEDEKAVLRRELSGSFLLE